MKPPKLILAAAATALALSACGSSGPKPPCAVLSNGNQLCGNALVSWCELEQVGINPAYPQGSSTAEACVSASTWQDRGQKVITVGPNSNGTGLTTTP